MKKTGKKLFALLLALVMLAVALPFSATAEENELKENGFCYKLMFDLYESFVYSAKIYACDETVTGDVVVPATIGGYKVTSADVQAFCDRKDITSVTLSEGVVWSGNCSNEYSSDSSNWENGVLYYESCLLSAKDLTGEYKVKDGTITISSSAFYNNDNLTSVILPDSVRNIGSSAFIAKNLEKLDLGNGVKRIGAECIMSEKLTRLAFPESIELLDFSAVFSCPKLKEIILPNTPIEIGGYVFNDTAYYNDPANWDNGLLYIGNHLIKVDPEVFAGERLDVREGTRSIAATAAMSVTSLKTVTLPESLGKMATDCFAGCSSLENINIPKSITAIPFEAFIADNFKSVIIPENIETIGAVSYAYCQRLESVTLPQGLRGIGSSAFAHCDSLKEINIPNTVERIYDEAFIHCPQLKKVIIPREVEYIGENAFGYEFCDGKCGDEYCDDRLKSDITICGYKNSQAEKYANENGFEFIDLESIGEPEPPVDPSEGCTCRCHKDGFENFIYKILRIFWKIFKINEDCVCGAKHY